MSFEDHSVKPEGRSLWRKLTHYVAILTILVGTLPAGTSPAKAMFGTKTLTILHMHTGEMATITFARSGRYDQQALDKLNWLLRDWRTDEPIKMDPRLFDLLSEVYEQSGSRQPIRVVSAYRSPKTNAMLRRRSKMVAEHSQHMLGKAMDFYLTDVSPERIRSIAMRMQDGGVGYYPNANTPFIHLDVGSVRAWPRMTRAQLSNLFPDGKTVHIPADGRPLPGYDAAKAMVLARGGRVAGESYAYADASESGGKKKSFWATLFGGSDEEEDTEVQVPTRVASARNTTQRTATNDSSSDSPLSFFSKEQQQDEPTRAPRPTQAQFRVAARTPEPLPVRAITPAAAPVFASVPLPPSRQLAFASAKGAQVVWQASSAAKKGNENNPFGPAATGSQIAFNSNSNRKAGEDGIGHNVMTYAPLPPSRPSSTVASNSKRGVDLADKPITTASISIKTPAQPAQQKGKMPSLTNNAVKPTSKSATASKPADGKAKKNEVKKNEPAKATIAKGKAEPKTKVSASQAHAILKPVSAKSGGFTKSVYANLPTDRLSGPPSKTTKR